MVSTLSTAQFAAAACHSIRQVDELAYLTWQAWSEGHITDDAAQDSQEAVQRRKASLRASVATPPERLPKAPPRRPIRGPAQRRKSITRRRRLSASGVLPASLAGGFTQGETSVLTVIGRECRKQRHHRCELTIDAIAALAGVCRSLAQRALHEADRFGIISLTERRRPSQRSLPNVVTIISSQWRVWLRLALGGVGPEKETPRITRSYSPTRTPKTTSEASAKPREVGATKESSKKKEFDSDQIGFGMTRIGYLK